MTPSPNELDGVRQIMRKLDRSITDARDRRLRKSEPQRHQGDPPVQAQPAPQPQLRPAQGGRFGAPNVGKARPLIRREDGPPGLP